MIRIGLRGMLLVFVLALFGCGGNDVTVQQLDASKADAASSPAAIADAGAGLDADRYAWVLDPGEPGVDYDPARITVTFKDNARLPKGVSAIQPAPGQRAADQGNSFLRMDQYFEVITDAIAASHNMEITNQVYWGEVNFAGFRLPDGADGDAILAAIRSDFADAIEMAHYSLLYYSDAGWSPNDPDYTSSTGEIYSKLWGLHKINSSTAWGITRGAGSEWIAVVDTGVRITHEELSAQVLDPDNLTKPADTYCNVVDNNDDVSDTDGHGTFIAGELVAQTNNSHTLAGAAHLCKVLPIKITHGGTAAGPDMYEGCATAYNLGARVISLSFGNYDAIPAMEDLINQIWGFGGIFVASAGNDGNEAWYTPSTAHYPSDYANAIGVGATGIDDARLAFSNYSSGVDIAAPGAHIKSCDPSSDTSYVGPHGMQGTSFSSPLVAGAAALLWSYNPALTNQEIRDILLDTAAPTTGFTQGTVGRLDMGAALTAAAGLQIDIMALDQLLYSGTESFTADVSGEPDRVDCLLNNQLVDSRSSAPWTFPVDTSAIDYGLANVKFTAVRGAEQISASVDILVDNTAGLFPLAESFETPQRDFLPLELKEYDVSLLSNIKSIPGPGANWSAQDITSGGPGIWNDDGIGTYDGFTCKRFGTGAKVYGAYEINALVSRRIDLNFVADATMVFHHRYNIEDGGSDYDRALVYITTDDGATYTPAILNGGGSAMFSGYQSDYSKVEIDLSAYLNETIHVVMVFESDPAGVGEAAGDAGWWVDKITIAMNYAEDIPTIDGVDVSPSTTVGLVPAVSSMDINVLNPDNVSRVRFALDFLPLGVVDTYDLSVQDSEAPFNTMLEVPTGFNNQQALLSVFTFSETDVPGVTAQVPVFVFNLLGDTNGDGIVNTLDLAGYPAQIGLTSSDAGYIPFFDSDISSSDPDGTITELDANAVGYNYGNTL